MDCSAAQDPRRSHPELRRGGRGLARHGLPGRVRGAGPRRGLFHIRSSRRAGQSWWANCKVGEGRNVGQHARRGGRWAQIIIELGLCQREKKNLSQTRRIPVRTHEILEFPIPFHPTQASAGQLPPARAPIQARSRRRFAAEMPPQQQQPLGWAAPDDRAELEKQGEGEALFYLARLAGPPGSGLQAVDGDDAARRAPFCMFFYRAPLLLIFRSRPAFIPDRRIRRSGATHHFFYILSDVRPSKQYDRSRRSISSCAG